MKSSVVFLLLSICLSTLVNIHGQDTPSTIPVFIWSGEKYFTENAQTLDTISSNDIHSLLKTSVGIPTDSGSLDVYLENLKEAHPEVVVIFVQPKIAKSTRHLTSLPKLKDQVKTSSSSITIPYSIATHSLAEALISIASTLKQQSPSSTTILVHNGASTSFNSLQANSNIINKSQADFLNFLTSDKQFRDGVTDLVVVEFDNVESDQSLAEDDAYVGNVLDIIQKKTQGKFVAAFLAENSDESKLQRIHSPRDYDFIDELKFDTAAALEDSTGIDTYFPVPFIQVLITIFVLLIIAWIGICCTCYSQTPQKFETPKRKLQEVM